MELAEKLTRAVQENATNKPQVMQPITFSVGVAWYPGLAADALELFQQSKRAAFYAKRNGKDRIQVYEGSINEESQDKETGYEQVAPTVYALVAAIDAKDFPALHQCIPVCGIAGPEAGLVQKRYPDRKGGRPFA